MHHGQERTVDLHYYFHIDFGMQDVEFDGQGRAADYGRIIAVEKYVKFIGVHVAFIATNSFAVPSKIPADNVQQASQLSADRALKFFEGYMKAEGQSDYLVLQRWQPYPIPVGPETNSLSSLGIFKSIIDSQYFPK
jgi:hypothetical protein